MKMPLVHRTRVSFGSALAALALTATPATAQFVLAADDHDAVNNFEGAVYTPGDYFLPCDKLVVVITGENGSTYSANVNALTFGGVALTRAVDHNPVDGQNTLAADIWYLDDPAPSEGSFDVTVAPASLSNSPKYVFSVFFLAQTAPGHGATAISAFDSKTVSLTTTGPNSLVLTSHALGGDGNTGAANQVFAIAPAEQFSGISVGNAVGHAVSITLPVAAAGPAIYGFEGGSATGCLTLAVEFREGSVPEVETLSPANNAFGVAVDANLLATFSETIALGTGTITLKNLTTATDTVFTLPDPQVTVSGATLTINPTADLLVGNDYAIRIAGTVIKDPAGNSFAGMADDTTWKFRTFETVPPTLVGIVDDKGGGPVVPNTPITYTVTFDEAMDAGTVAAEDFGNAGSCAVTLGTVTATGPGVFSVPAIPTSTGTLQLQLLASAVVKDGTGNILVAKPVNDDTVLEVVEPNTYWDLNGSTAGAGGATPSGNWNAADPFWNAVADGTGPTKPWVPGQVPVFAAGTDAGGSYTVTLAETLDIGGLTFEEGTVAISGGASLRMVADATATVAPGLSATIGTSISQDAATRSLIKSGAGNLILSNANTFTGETRVNAGTLTLSGSGTTGNGSPITMGGGQLDLGALSRTVGAVSVAEAAAGGDTILNGSLTGASYAAGNPSGDAIISANLLANGSAGFTKTGAGTVTLTGNNTYTGATTIDGGALAFATVNPVLTGALRFGSAPAITTPGILDLTSASATFGPGGSFPPDILVVQTNSETANEVRIGPARILTIQGNVAVGATAPATNGTITKLKMTGGGTLNVTGSRFSVAESTSTSNSQFATLDLSELAAANITTSSDFRINPNATTTANIGGGASLFLPAPDVADTVPTTNLTIQGLLTIGGGNSTLGTASTNRITLGTGLTTLRTSRILIGSNARDLGQIIYGQERGDFIFRAFNGTDRANEINVGYINGSTDAAGTPILMDLSGHDADILVISINVGGQSRTNNQEYGFSFGEGDGSLASKLDAINANVGLRRNSTTSTTAIATARLNLSGGTVTFGNSGGTGDGVLIGSSLYDKAGAAGSIGELNISGGTVMIHNYTSLGAAVRLGNNVTAGGGTVTASMNLTGGTTTLAGDIIRGATSPRTTSILKISGGTLDMGGNDIGSDAATITLTAESGELRNVATINSTGGLTKTTAGNLVLSGSNTYSGGTLLSAGTLTLGSGNPIPDSSPVAIAAATLDATTAGTEVVGTLDVTGSATLHLAAGAQIAFADSSAPALEWNGGTLDITGDFVPGSSIRFGGSSGGLRPAQLAVVSVNGSGAGTYTLDPSGYLVVGTVSNYTTWADSRTPPVTGGPNGDSDNDGVKNLIEYALADGQERGSFTGDTLSFTKRGAPWGTDITYDIETSTTLETGSWTTLAKPPVVEDPGSISYTFTPGPGLPENFGRLKVTQITP